MVAGWQPKRKTWFDKYKLGDEKSPSLLIVEQELNDPVTFLLKGALPGRGRWGG
jgi:hypothetical protein